MSVKYQKFKEQYQNLLSLYDSHEELVNDLASKQGLDPNTVDALRKKYGDEKLGQLLAYKQTDTSMLDEFLAGVKAQTLSSVTDLGTLFGALTGNKEFAQKMYESGQEYMQKEGTSYSFRDVLSDPSHLMDYIAGTVGNTLGFMGPSGLAGVFTKGLMKVGGKALAKATGKKIAEDVAKKEIAEALAEEGVKQGLLKNIASKTAKNMFGTPARTASTLTMYGQTAGNIYGQQPADEKNVITSLLGSGVITALEYGLGVNPTNIPIFKKAFGGKVAEKIAEAGTKPSIKKAIGEALKVGGEEALEEVAQTPVENLAVDGSFGKIEDYIEGAAGGFFGGLALGGLGKGYSNYQEQRKAYEEAQKAKEEENRLAQEQAEKVEQEKNEREQRIYRKQAFVDSLLGQHGLTRDDVVNDPEVSSKFNGFMDAIKDGTAEISVVDRGRTIDDKLTELESKQVKNLEEAIKQREAELNNPYLDPDKVEENSAFIDNAKKTLEQLKTKKKQADLQVVDENGNVHSFRDLVENVFKKKQAEKEKALQEEKEKLEKQKQDRLNEIIVNTYKSIMGEDNVEANPDPNEILTFLELDRNKIVKRVPEKPTIGKGKNKQENPHLNKSLEELEEEAKKDGLTKAQADIINAAIQYQKDLSNKFKYRTETKKGIEEIDLDKVLEEKIRDKIKEQNNGLRPINISLRKPEETTPTEGQQEAPVTEPVQTGEGVQAEEGVSTGEGVNTSEGVGANAGEEVQQPQQAGGVNDNLNKGETPSGDKGSQQAPKADKPKIKVSEEDFNFSEDKKTINSQITNLNFLRDLDKDENNIELYEETAKALNNYKRAKKEDKKNKLRNEINEKFERIKEILRKKKGEESEIKTNRKDSNSSEDEDIDLMIDKLNSIKEMATDNIEIKLYEETLNKLNEYKKAKTEEDKDRLRSELKEKFKQIAEIEMKKKEEYEASSSGNTDEKTEAGNTTENKEAGKTGEENGIKGKINLGQNFRKTGGQASQKDSGGNEDKENSQRAEPQNEQKTQDESKTQNKSETKNDEVDFWEPSPNPSIIDKQFDKLVRLSSKENLSVEERTLYKKLRDIIGVISNKVFDNTNFKKEVLRFIGLSDLQIDDIDSNKKSDNREFIEAEFTKEKVEELIDKFTELKKQGFFELYNDPDIVERVGKLKNAIDTKERIGVKVEDKYKTLLTQIQKAHGLESSDKEIKAGSQSKRKTNLKASSSGGKVINIKINNGATNGKSEDIRKTSEKNTENEVKTKVKSPEGRSKKVDDNVKKEEDVNVNINIGIDDLISSNSNNSNNNKC